MHLFLSKKLKNLTYGQNYYKIFLEGRKWQRSNAAVHNVKSIGPVKPNGIGENGAKRTSAAIYVIFTKSV